MTQLHELKLEGNGFAAGSVVGCDAWRDIGIPQPPNEIIRGGFNSLIQYIFSEDKVATNAIRIFVVGESTVRCFFFDVFYNISLRNYMCCNVTLHTLIYRMFLCRGV